MSFQALQWTGSIRGLRAGDKLVLFQLSWHMNESTGQCSPSLQLLGVETGKGRNDLRRSIARLEAAGLVTRSRSPGGATSYVIHTGCETTPGVKRHRVRNDTRGGCETTPGEGAKSHPEQGKNKERTGNPITTGHVPESTSRDADARNAASVDPAAITSPAPSEPRGRKATRQAQTHLLELEDLPPAWRDYCAAVRPDLDPDRVFQTFRFYWLQGRGSGTRRSDKGWAQSWQVWVRNEKEFRPSRAETPADLDRRVFGDISPEERAQLEARMTERMKSYGLDRHAFT